MIRNSLLLGDCVEVISKNIVDNSIDLVLFSPPYDRIRDYNKNWTFDFKSLGIELYRVIKDNGVVIIVIGDGTKDHAKSLTSFRLAVNWVDEIGFKLFETIIYNRNGNPGAWWNKRFRVDHEFIFIFFKGDKPKAFNKDHLMVPSKNAGKIWYGTDRLTNGGFKVVNPTPVNEKKCRGTVWKYSTSNSEGNRIKLKHPATFPDKLAEDLILAFSNEGDIVLDPMCGSGTTCRMAFIHNRDFIGIDINADYVYNIAKPLLEKIGWEGG